MNHVEVMKQALDALEYAHATCPYERARQDRATADLRKAIAQAEKAEPAAWAISYDGGKTPYSLWEGGDGALLDLEIKRMGGSAQKMALYTASPAAQPSQQEPDRLHLAAMDLARKQAGRINELEAEVERFRADAMNEKSARQSLEQQLAALEEAVKLLQSRNMGDRSREDAEALRWALAVRGLIGKNNETR